MMKHTTAGIAVLVAAMAATAGTASANTNLPDANCAGLVFTMPQGEQGTVVRTFLDGNQVRIDTIAAQFDPLTFTVPSPDQTVAHVWSITIDSVWNTGQAWSETVPACTQPTTTSTTPPATTSTSVPVVASTVVTTTSMPSPSTVVTTPRAPGSSTTTSSVPVQFALPATGPSGPIGPWLAAAASLLCAGIAVRRAVKR
jgi:hypothetical protein